MLEQTNDRAVACLMLSLLLQATPGIVDSVPIPIMMFKQPNVNQDGDGRSTNNFRTGASVAIGDGISVVGCPFGGSTGAGEVSIHSFNKNGSIA